MAERTFAIEDELKAQDEQLLRMEPAGLSSVHFNAGRRGGATLSSASRAAS